MYKLEVIIEYYGTHEMLTESYRKKMCHAIIAYFMHFEVWLSRADFEVLTRLIINEFPNEDPFLYYKPPDGYSSNPKGILWYRFVNQSVNWRSKLNGIFKNRKKSTPKPIEKRCKFMFYIFFQKFVIYIKLISDR